MCVCGRFNGYRFLGTVPTVLFEHDVFRYPDDDRRDSLRYLITTHCPDRRHFVDRTWTGPANRATRCASGTMVYCFGLCTVKRRPNILRKCAKSLKYTKKKRKKIRVLKNRKPFELTWDRARCFINEMYWNDKFVCQWKFVRMRFTNFVCLFFFFTISTTD